jgi:uncharacterized protein YjbI with pentapeptide repeats
MAGEKYDQAFFLALATKGKDAWNAWRRGSANKDVYVTFEGVDFSEAPKDRIDFSGFEFGHHANFSKCKWRGAEWRECEDNRETFTFGRACFTSATFGHGARFNSSAFGNGGALSVDRTVAKLGSVEAQVVAGDGSGMSQAVQPERRHLSVRP